VDARAYAVYDEGGGRQLASSNADDRLPVGSLMKLLNAYVAYRAGEPERTVVAPDDLAGAADESVIGIGAGQAITRRVLLRAMLKVSANDAARLLALDIAGSEERYAAMMNDAAADLALVDTHAANASGLDADGQFSSAHDLITLGTALLRDATFRQTVSEPTAEFNGQTFPNTNDLLGAYAGADGIKTGHTSDAGWCILASATRAGRRIVVVVLGAPTEARRDDAAQTLLDWGFARP
jgi:D-alanyl-D-alanine carboxypeptidase (penicillin-binding protein 5/6)